MATPAVTLGIDIGGTNTKLGLVDRAGHCLRAANIATHSEKPFKEYLPRLLAEMNDLLAGGEPVDLKGIGIGAPNANYYSGAMELAVNFKWGDYVPLRQHMQEHFDLPVALTNDANAAAIGEMQFGVAKGMKNFVVITLGTGLDSGIVVNGQLLLGADGFAGEMGHMLVRPLEGRVCGNNRKGCLEAYVSATGIKRTVFKLLADMTEPSEMRQVSYDDLSAHIITEAAQRGDRIAQAAFAYTGRILGMKLADSVAILSPEAIILFGGLAQAGDYLVLPVKEEMEKFLLPIFRNKVRLLTSNLTGENTAVLGAAALIWKELDA